MTSSDPAINPRDLIIPTIISTLWASAFGILMSALPVLIVWILGASGAGSLTSAIRTSFLAWPISHGTPVTITSVQVDVLPILAVLFPIFILRRVSIRIFRIVPYSKSSLILVLVSITSVNTLLSFLLAWLVSDEVISISPVLTPLIVAAISVLAVLIGALRVYGRPNVSLHQSIKTGVRAGLIISTALIVAGLLLVLIRFGLNLSSAIEIVASVADTNSEKFLTWILTLGYLPIAIIWGYAWLLGPGVSTGIDSAASFAVIDQTALPALPWLAALPETSPENGWFVLLIPVLISTLVATLMWWSLHNLSYRILFTNTLSALVVIALVAVSLSLIGGGAIGPGRLEVFGPQWFPMIGGVSVTIAPVFVLILILDGIRRWISNRKQKESNA